MKRFYLSLLSVSIMAMMPVIAGAAGTYYNGNLYQNPQRYGNNGGGYYNSYGAGRGYDQGMQTMGTQKYSAQKSKKSTKNNATKQGFVLDIAASHEFANWKFDMNQSGSKLHYDNVEWNVISGEGVYYFNTEIPMQIKLGARYGKQFGETPMVDDDMTNEAMWKTQLENVDAHPEYVLQGTPAISVGTSKGGTQTGFNVSFGLTDFVKLGNVKLTPSLGYRYFKHKLSTEKNYGAMINVVNSDSFVNCLEVQPGEIQCSPYVGFADASGVVGGYAGFAVSDTYIEGSTVAVKDVNGNTVYVLVNPDGSLVVSNDTGAPQIDVGETYYYEQAGKTHIYETTWAGPYLALDMEYTVNNDNFVSAGVEFGLPMYTSTGDQPYRYDWAHPKSVEDKGSFGDAYHLGLNAMWTTKVADSVGLSFGFTYDYYNVKDATAKTFYNQSVYQNLLNKYEAWEADGVLTDVGEADLRDLRQLKANGWSEEISDEIKSIYKSMGIRMGVNIKF
jgi:hypothetical protein